MFAINLTEKIPGLHNAKKHNQLFIRKENIKSVKQSKIITQLPKTFENQNIVDIKSVITEHPKSSRKLSKSIRQSEKVGSNSSSYSYTTKRNENFLNKKNVKITNQAHAFKDCILRGFKFF